MLARRVLLYQEAQIMPVFEKMGVIIELRLVKNFETGKRKGYGFVRYSTPEESKCALQELFNIKSQGKKCGVVPHEEKDSVFIGNIDKKWTKDDVLNKLKEVGVENIIDVTVIEEPNNPFQRLVKVGAINHQIQRELSAKSLAS